MALATVITRPHRWEVPFGADMTPGDVDRVLLQAPFSQIDQTKFPSSASLRDILLNDARIVHFEKGDIVVREGDYGSSAFFIIAGSVDVVLKSLPPALLGRREAKKKGFFGAVSQLWRNPRFPEVRHISTLKKSAGLGARTRENDDIRVFLHDYPVILKENGTARIEQGEFFGEMAALGRTPRSATVVATGTTYLLEIRWQGLRDIRLRAPELKAHIDQLYRERALTTHLRETPMFRRLSEEHLAIVAAGTRFETYGQFDWYGDYKKMGGVSSAERLKQETVIASECQFADGLILIRAGFARLSQQYNNGERTTSYVARGQTYGFREICHNWRTKEQRPLQFTLRALGYVDVLIVPVALVQQYVLPTLPRSELPDLLPKAEPDVEVTEIVRERGEMDTGFMEFLVENRFINGTAAMVIDLERCTRCDDCVRACSAGHSNNPRFIRHGMQHGRFMIANACMHCIDPVCMIGCPTGAIHRSSVAGQVVVNDATCIGCATCANSCPYDNIQMVQIRNERGDFIRDDATQAPINKAAKCDLCVDQLGGPACARACPHDALGRLDMSDVDSLAKWLRR